jgi:putative nucleotidyltransferase with HDIG domain
MGQVNAVSAMLRNPIPRTAIGNACSSLSDPGQLSAAPWSYPRGLSSRHGPNGERSAFEEALGSGRPLELLGNWGQARERYKAPLVDGSTLSNAERMTLLRRVAGTYLEEGACENAMTTLREALRLAQVDDDRSGIASALNMMGLVERLQGNLTKAARLTSEARSHAISARDAETLSRIDLNLGTIENIRGNYAQALAHYQSSLDATRALGMRSDEVQILNNMGMLHTDLEQWDLAESSYREAHEICVQIGDVQRKQGVEVNQIELWIARGSLGEAREQCERLIAQARTQSDTRWLGEVYKHYGVVCLTMGQLERAEESFRRADDIASDAKDLLLSAEIARERAELYWQQLRHREMLDTLNRARTWFARFEASRDLLAVARHTTLLEERFVELVGRLADSIESKDRYTRGHSERVANVACALAKQVGIDEHQLFWIRIGALLHDVGKMIVPAAVLNKPGKLTPEEWALMRRHPEAGVELLADVDFPEDVITIVRSHHERWNGSGYPHGLSGDAIPLSARIVSIADAYDTLTSTRSYQQALGHEEALAAMEAAAFDPHLFRIFLEECAPKLDSSTETCAAAVGGKSVRCISPEKSREP